MKIFVKIFIKELITLDVEPSDTIEIVLDKIQEINSSSPLKLRLVFAGKALENQQTISNYNILQNSTLYLAPRYYE